MYQIYVPLSAIAELIYVLHVMALPAKCINIMGIVAAINRFS